MDGDNVSRPKHIRSNRMGVELVGYGIDYPGATVTSYQLFSKSVFPEVT
jgi:hypothetical protein